MWLNPAPGLHCHIFIPGYINKAFPLHSLVTKYGEEMTNALFPFIKAGPTTLLPRHLHARRHAYTHLKCASAASACRAPCSLNLAVVKVHRRWSLTSHARFVIDRGSLSSDLRQRIRGITSFEWFDATRPGSVLLYASTLWWDAACRLGASFTTLHELSAVCPGVNVRWWAFLQSLSCVWWRSRTSWPPPIQFL